MTGKQIIIVLIASLLVTQTITADVWQDIGGYNYGDEYNPCEQAEKLLQETPATQYRPIEDKLIAVLESNNSTQDGKSIACRFLLQMGTDRCIPAVSALLGDEVLSHYARLVLERLESDAADKAMRNVLSTAPDQVKIGILGSLGSRRDGRAVEQVSKLVASRNAAVAAAALEALGKIGGPEAARQLESARPPENLKPAQMRAMAACARSLPPADSVALCRRVLDGSDKPARVAAMMQLAIADPAKALPIITKAIKGSDPEIREGAFSIVAETEDRKVTNAMAGLLGQLPDDRRAKLIVALGTRGDEAALRPVSRYLNSEKNTVRFAAIKTVGKLGDAGVVRSLLEAADSPETSTAVARAVVGMKGYAVDAVLVDLLSQDNFKTQAIEACVARGCNQAVPALLKLTQDEDSDVRKGAWAGLGSLASDEHIKSIMSIVLEIEDDADLSRAENAIKSILSRADNRSTCFETIASFYSRASEAKKLVILDLAAAVGDSNALNLVRRASKSSDKQISDAALRAMAKWPNESAAPDLLKLARNAPETVDRIVALRGYIRIAGLKTARLSDKKRVDMLKTAMDIATRTEEKKQVIGALQNVRSLESLKMLEKYLDHPQLQAEAQMSAANLIWDMRRRHKAEIAEIAEQLAESKNRRVADRAKRTLRELNKNN